MGELPHWRRGAAGVLCASGPHPIPVSTAVRVRGDRLLLALGRQRETLSRLRHEPRAAFCLMEAGIAFTAHGSARVVRDPLRSAEGVAAVELRVESVQDHLADGRTELLEGPRWRWRDERFAESERAIVEELEEL
jgi:hypothetical protein